MSSREREHPLRDLLAVDALKPGARLDVGSLRRGTVRGPLAPEAQPAVCGPLARGYASTGSPLAESSAGATWYSVSVCTSSITSCSASQRSASMAAMQPVPAAVTAWR